MSSSPPAIPKPTTAGAGKTALAITISAYANIRTGPGTHYLDIGDINKNTIVIYYPNSRTADGWIWVEQGQLVGWVATSVITFEDITTPTPNPPKTPTPYDGKVAIWHWKGDVLSENTIDAVASNLKKFAPHVTSLFVKTSDYTPSSGARWQGFWDTKRELAIDGPESIDKWVQTLGRYGIDFHAWCVPRGLNVNAEADLIAQACLRPGVKSMIIDIEPYDGFWSGGRQAVRPFMTRIRQQVPGSFHIGMGVDPRGQHYNTITPDEWKPFINSIHPMVYWATFRQTPEEALAESYRVWGGYGRPIIPILQGDGQVVDMRTAVTLSLQRHKAPALSWWRLGVIGPVEFTAVNQPITPGTTPPPVVTPPEQYGSEQVIKPGDTGFAKGSYTGKQEFLSFVGTWGWNVFYKSTSAQRSTVWVQWTPRLPQSDKFEISAFVPNRHATTHAARFKIHGVKGSSTEVVVSVDQARYKNQWVTLGVFDLDKSAINAGAVFLNDLTAENGLEIAFDAIRWRQVLDSTTPQPPAGTFLADGYDSPIGTEVERRSSQVWPGRWIDASPFGRLYFVGTPSEAYHTGADLNLPSDGDRFAPIYSAASGVVVFAGRLPTWGNVIIIKHDPLTKNGRIMYGRYAHVDRMLVSIGNRVKRGQQIATVGNAFGQWAYHLHFDLSPTTILETEPQHWPGKDQTALLQNYIDPRAFIEANRP